MTSWTGQVYGLPVAKGSMVCVRNPTHQIIDTKKKKLDPWVRTLTKTTRAVADLIPNAPLQGPVMVEATFTLPRPKTVKRDWPIGRNEGDVDKLHRALLDAITAGGVWVDDSQCVGGPPWKCYPGAPLDGALDRPGVHFTITPIGDQP